MKKENLFKTIIVLSGTGLTYFKYNLNEHLGVAYLLSIISILIVIFISTIFVLNNKIYRLKTIVIHPKLKSLFSDSKAAVLNANLKGKINYIKPQKIKNLKVIEAFLRVLVAGVFGIILGFYFKKPSGSMMMRFDTEYELKRIVDIYRSETSLFFLEGNHWDPEVELFANFDFNWIAFFIGITLIYLILLINKYLDFKKVFYPYLKERHK